MTLEEINNLTLEDSIEDVLIRLLDFSDVPEGEVHYYFEDDSENSAYNNLILHESLSKPSLVQFNDEFDDYIQELVNGYDAAVESARVSDINDRWNALSDVRSAISSASLDIPNPSMELKRIIEEDDQTRLALLETKDSEFQNAQSLVQYQEDRKSEYPSIDELIVALWEGDQTIIDDLEAARQVIKAKYPKPV